MKTRVNNRGFEEHYLEGRHLKLTDLKKEAKDLENQYLFKENIPLSPRPEFHLSHLKHDTKRYESTSLSKLQTAASSTEVLVLYLGNILSDFILSYFVVDANIASFTPLSVGQL